MAKRKYTVGARKQGTETHRDEMALCRWPSTGGDRIGLIMTGDPALVAAGARQAEMSRTETELNRAGFKAGHEGPEAQAGLLNAALATPNPATCDPNDILTQDTGVQWPTTASSFTP